MRQKQIKQKTYKMHVKLKKLIRNQNQKSRYKLLQLNINQTILVQNKNIHISMQFQQKYTLLQSLPTSSNNDMYRAKRNSDSKIFMVKKVHYSKLQQKQKQQIVQQVNILTQINSSSIVKYCQHFVQKVQNTLYIVMEYEPMDLLQIIKKYQEEGKYFSQEKVWKLLKQIVLALKDIHKNKKGIILHRNIQPKSVFINNISIKLGNFKFVKKLDTQEQFATTILTDTYYLSPEQLEDGVFTAKTDIWALGCLLYEVCTFNNPFQGNNIFQIGNKIKQGKIKSIPSIYKKQLNRVIRWCLAKDPKDRPSVEDLLGIPMINILIRQNRLSQVNKKINQKKTKTLNLQKQIVELQQKLSNIKINNKRNESTKTQSLKKSGGSQLTTRQKNSQNQQNSMFYETNQKRYQELILKRGISQKLSQKTNYLRTSSSNISHLSNYASTCEKGFFSKIKQNIIKQQENTYRQLNF